MPYKNIEITPAQYKPTLTYKKSQSYIGYSSVASDATNNVRLYDFDLIKQDLLNQFNTRLGERVMNPTFGTIIWSLIYEPFTDDIKQAIANDINRICNNDPRVVPIQLDTTEQEYGILLEITLQYIGTNQTTSMSLSFDRELGLLSQ